MASLDRARGLVRTGFAYTLCVLIGCTGSEGRDDGGPADATPDASDAQVPGCDVTKPFGTPVPVAGVNTGDNDKFGWQTADQLTIYFSRSPSLVADLYVATRAQPADPFTEVTPLNTVNTAFSEARPIVSADGLTLYMEYVDGSGVDIHFSTRTDTSGTFSAQMQLAVINTPGTMHAAEFNPWISNDGLTIYFTSDRDGYNDIFTSTRSSITSDFTTPVAVAELNSAGGDYMGALSADGLEIFFGSSRDTNLANDDIFHARRSSPSDAFTAPTKLTELSDASKDEYPTWLSSDRCDLMFTSNRSGNYDVWIVSRPQ
ncbi:MAG TPA: hypothetical protein VIV11_13610 [Kofleriaceae bacterium]